MSREGARVHMGSCPSGEQALFRRLFTEKFRFMRGLAPVCGEKSSRTRVGKRNRRRFRLSHVARKVTLSPSGDPSSTMSTFHEERVLSVRHWNDSLFSFTTTRNTGLPLPERPLRHDRSRSRRSAPFLRAFSLVSANYDEHLEFYSIKIPRRRAHVPACVTSSPDTPFSSSQTNRYASCSTTYVLGESLYLLGDGTGLAPFLSIIRDPRPTKSSRHVVLVHGVRQVSDLGYRALHQKELPAHELVGDRVKKQLCYYPTVTREPFRNQGRLSDLIESGKLASDLDFPALSPDDDRVMLCGSPAMLKDLSSLLEARGFHEGGSDGSGTYLVERAFVEK